MGLRSDVAIRRPLAGAREIMVSRAENIFAALSNRVRIGVCVRLLDREWSVNEMAVDIGVSQSALSQHLAKLRGAGVVKTRRDQQTIFYSCEDETVRDLIEAMGLDDGGRQQ